jgi:hypothetical protein
MLFSPRQSLFALVAVFVMLLNCGQLMARAAAAADEPPAVNPFGQAPSQREDAVPGYVELSDGSIHAGLVYLTRDKRLQVYDQKLQRQREVPLQVVKQIDCKVKKEWMEKEWKFKETTSDEKLYTGRNYPARQYAHTITLEDGRTVEGDLSGIIYVQPQSYDPAKARTYQRQADPERFILHKRDKGDIGTELKSLVYVRSVKLGKEALAEGQQKAGKRPSHPRE